MCEFDQMILIPVYGRANFTAIIQLTLAADWLGWFMLDAIVESGLTPSLFIIVRRTFMPSSYR